MDADQIRGKLQNVFGKAEEAVGKTIGSQNLVNAGTEDRLKGSATETWGNAKDAVSSVSETTQTHTGAAHTGVAQDRSMETVSLGDRVAGGAEHLRDSINAKLDGVKERER